MSAEIGRRLLLGLSSAYVAALAADYIYDMADTGEKYKTPPSVENLSLNRINLQVLTVEHWVGIWPKYGDVISQAISSADVVIPEYFPPEYLGLTEGLDNAIARNYNDSNELFFHTADQFKDKQKDVWLVDPAYNNDLIHVRMLATIPQNVASTAALYPLAHKIVDKGIEIMNDEEFDDEPKSSRRKFFAKVLGAATAGALIMPYNDDEDGHLPEYLAEGDFRNVVVAEQLVQLANSGAIPQGANVLLLYPAGHWKFIKQYMQDDVKRAERLGLYKTALGSVFPSLFERRHYPNGVFEQPHQTASIL